MIKKPLPSSQGRRVQRTGAFRGIDRRNGAAFGSFKNAVGAMCTDGVTVHGGPSWEKVYTFSDDVYPLSACAAGDGIFTMCRVIGFFGDTYIQDGNVKLVVYTEDGDVYQSLSVSDRDSEETVLVSDINYPRSMVQFNVYSESGQLSDAVGGTYDKKLLIFPEKMAVDLPVSESGFDMVKMEEVRGDVPDLLYVTVSGARLFGVDKSRIYASAYNDPWDWDVDTADDIGASNAWVSTTGADTRGDGDFTGVCAYDGKVFGMKADFGHIVDGQSNPFTVKDTDAIGALDFRAVARGDGRLFFVRRDGVRMAEGDSVRVISDPLCIDEFTCGMCTYRDGVFYMAEGDTLYAYHRKTDAWSALPMPPEGRIISLLATDSGIYALMQAQMWENYLYRLSGEAGEWEFELSPTDFSIDTDKGPATLTLHARAAQDSTVSVSLRENHSGRVIALGSKAGNGGEIRFRTHIRGGAGHSYSVLVSVTGEAVIRGVSITARSGVKDDG